MGSKRQRLVAALALAAVAAGSMAGTNPSWDKKRIGAARFKVLTQMDGEAVLDKETGLVWERSPSTGDFAWSDAQAHCNDLAVSNRKGWRLPTIQELASLVDLSVTELTLPAGYPFSVSQGDDYWSATTFADDPSAAWRVAFFGGVVEPKVKTFQSKVWCVRGAQGVDPQ